MRRETLRSITSTLLHLFARVEYRGLEHLPPEGPFIVVTNHLSQLDTAILFTNPVRPDMTALVADKYKNQAFLRWFISTGEAIWIDREKADFVAFRDAMAALRAGKPLGIAPEGTRSRYGTGLQEGKAGAVLLALKANVPVVPVGIHGTEDGFRRIFLLQRPRMVAQFGAPFTLPPLDRDNREESIKKTTDEVMCRIAAQLPPAYRGFYADHPRLKELEGLSQKSQRNDRHP